MPPEPRVEVTQYAVSMFPAESINSLAWDLTVEQRAPGQWAVCRMRQCLTADGTWDYEPLPSSRTDEWKAAHRFDLDTALRLAREAAPHVVVNGMTPAQCGCGGTKRYDH